MARCTRRNDGLLEAMVRRARSATKIPDLTFRMCRTTFATLFEVDIGTCRRHWGIMRPNSPFGTTGDWLLPGTRQQWKNSTES